PSASASADVRAAVTAASASASFLSSRFCAAASFFSLLAAASAFALATSAWAAARFSFSRARQASSSSSACARAASAAARSLPIWLSRWATVPITLGTMPRPMTKNTIPKNTSSQKIWLEKVSASWAIWGIEARPGSQAPDSGGRKRAGRAKPGRRRIVGRSGDEDQDHRHDERQQAEKLGSGEADEQAALLAVCGTRVAQRALEERAEHVTHADRGHARTDRGETSANQLCSFYVHVKTPLNRIR